MRRYIRHFVLRPPSGCGRRRHHRGCSGCSRSAGSEAVNYASSWSRPAAFISSINLSVKPSLA